MERQDGRRYNFSRGVSSLQTSYESASTSKLVSAVIILRLVEQGYLSLADRPQDWIDNWPITSGDLLSSLTLSQLLSFTSGLTIEPFCLNSGISNFESCVTNIAAVNADNGITPGQEFYYASTHLQVAGLMAVKARGVVAWQDVFTEFKAQTGLFPTATYDLPSSSNPRLAGGMHWTGEEYMEFLKALKNGSLLNTASMSDLLTDHTASATLVYSPAVTGLGEDWHYGFGLWHECQSEAYNCSAGTRVSSPGAYGAYPFWDRSKRYFGIVVRQGTLGTFPNGVAIERAVRSNVEAWAACPITPVTEANITSQSTGWLTADGDRHVSIKTIGLNNQAGSVHCKGTAIWAGLPTSAGASLPNAQHRHIGGFQKCTDPVVVTDVHDQGKTHLAAFHSCGDGLLSRFEPSGNVLLSVISPFTGCL